MTTTWHEGDRVRVRGETWVIGAVQPHGHCVELRLHGLERDNARAALSVLWPFDRPRRADRPLSPRRVRPRRWLHEVRRLACGIRPFGALADGALSLSILPYQLEPALAMLRRGATRVLVADGVGLGKTVQAGLVLSALHARDVSLRALIVTPAGLREQWAAELHDRFGIDATVAGAAWLRDAARALPPDVVPWAVPGVFITSYDFLKRPEVLRPIEDVVWDLVVADEAHNASPGTARRAAVDAVARRSLRVLLLTATPDGGEAGEFEALCAIGQAEGAPDEIVIFRRTGAAVGRGTIRKTTRLRVRPTAAEVKLHRVLDRYTSRLRRPGPARLAAILLQKRALSSARALADSAQRRLALLTDPDLPRQIDLPLGDDEPLDDQPDDGVLAVPGLTDASRERQLLEGVIRAAMAATPESKPAFLLRLLARIREPVIVFTEYRDTLRRLSRALAAGGHAITLLHGGMSATERAAAQRAFNEQGGVLLATDAASEGLNLHLRCRTVVHYELPWTPMRLEQRAGRVDRIGQKLRVHEILLVSAHPAEELVLVPLAKRAARIGFGTLSERLVADAILDGTELPDAPGRSPVPACMELGAEARAEANRIEECRRWRALSVPSAVQRARGHGVWVARIRHHRAVHVHQVTLRTASGRVVHDELLAVASDSDIGRDRVLMLAGARLDRVQDQHRDAEAALESRAVALRARIGSTARALVQAGLFDRRALRQRDDGERRHNQLAEQLETEAVTAHASRDLVRDATLVAVLLP